MERIAIAIDGPASSGKGTVARQVAARLGYDHVDTGAMYRAVALMAQRAGLAWNQEEPCTELALRLHFAFPCKEGQVHTVVDGEDLSSQIRTAAIGQGASMVAAIPGVRRALLETQRALGQRGGVVMDGRDIGTVVLPNARLKIYLDASLQERARRRALELGTTPELLIGELAERDARDANRSTAPLRCADDAVRLDTTGLSIPEVVEKVLILAFQRMGL